MKKFLLHLAMAVGVFAVVVFGLWVSVCALVYAADELSVSTVVFGAIAALIFAICWVLTSSEE